MGVQSISHFLPVTTKPMKKKSEEKNLKYKYGDNSDC